MTTPRLLSEQLILLGRFSCRPKARLDQRRRFRHSCESSGPQHVRFPFQNNAERQRKSIDTVLYASSVFVGFIGLSYAAVPLYRLFCQATGFGGTVRTDDSYHTPEKMIAARQSRKIKVTFNADTSKSMLWRFQPQQNEVYVHPGETSLIFYTAENPTDHDITGISAYNVVPMKAGAYFNKIQCFCFEEQKLKAGEQVDMPVFFFIDPEIDKDPLMDNVDEIMLSYTFFNAQSGVPYLAGLSSSSTDPSARSTVSQ